MVAFSICYAFTSYLWPHSLKIVWQRMQQLYQDLGIVERYRYFNRITMFKKQSGAVKLRGKAAEVKNVGLVVLNLWQQYHNGAVEVHRMVLAMLKMNVKMESILADHKHENHFSPMAAEQFQAAAFQMGHLNHLIANHFEKEEGVPNVCNMTAKLHMVMHCAQYSGALNPRLVWCFSGEDYMRFMKTLGQQCCKGLQPQDVCTKMVQHWRLGMHFHLEKVWGKSFQCSGLLLGLLFPLVGLLLGLLFPLVGLLLGLFFPLVGLLLGLFFHL